MTAVPRIGLVLLAALALAACASPTPYQPRGDGYGYSEQRLEPNRYRVSFVGNSATPRETVENYLLFRAAELTLKEGKDYFVLVGQDTEGYVSGGDPGVGFGTGFGWGSRGNRTFSGISFGGGPRVTRYAAHADILLREGKKPEDEPRAYGARDLIASLEPKVVRGDVAAEPNWNAPTPYEGRQP